MGRNGVGATLPSQPPAHGPGSAPFFPQTWLINYEDIFDLSLCLTRRILIKIPLGVRQLPQRHKPDARLPSVTNDLLRNSDPAKWAQPCALDISSAFQQPHHHALWPLPAAAGEFNGCASKSFHRYLSKCLYSARVNGWRSSHPAWLPSAPRGPLRGGRWGRHPPLAHPWVLGGSPRVPLPVRGYPRVGDHDGLQVEAAVTQIPAGEEGELQEVRDGSTGTPIPQSVGCGGAGRAGTAAYGAKRGTHGEAEAEPGCCSVSPAGYRHCCFHF